MAGLLGGANYSMNQASYDLARLRLNGLITRIPRRNRYRLTSDGLAFAIFYTKLALRESECIDELVECSAVE